MKVYDFHAHPVTSEFIKAMDDLGINVIEDDGFPLPKWSIESHLDFMKEAGIDYTILSIPTPHIHNGDDNLAAIAARKINTEISNICANNSEHFSFVAGLPLPCVDKSIEELNYALDNLNAIGVKVPTNAYGIYLGDKTLDPLMEELNKRKALVIIHPCRARLRPTNCITGTVAAIYEYPSDTTRAVLNMMANKIMTRFPDIKWVVPHCGSFLPYMLQRFTGVSGILSSMGMMEQIDASKEFEKLYFDIAGDIEPVGLDMLRMVTDDSHILFGSDFPHSPAKVIEMKKKHFDENHKYDDIRNKIYYDNAVKVLESRAL